MSIVSKTKDKGCQVMKSLEELVNPTIAIEARTEAWRLQKTYGKTMQELETQMSQIFLDLDRLNKQSDKQKKSLNTIHLEIENLASVTTTLKDSYKNESIRADRIVLKARTELESAQANFDALASKRAVPSSVPSRR